MAHSHDADHPIIGTVELNGSPHTARCRVVWDGVEFVGRISFTEDAAPRVYYPDRGAFPGRTHDEAVALARRLTHDELAQRLARARAEKRRFMPLRKTTDEILAKVRYMNQLALSVRAGLLDADGAAGEIELTEQQLHDLIRTLRDRAGVEE